MNGTRMPLWYAVVLLGMTFILCCDVACAADSAPQALARQAGIRRREAEDALAQARTRRVRERKEIASQLATEYERLDAARVALAAAEATRQRLEREGQGGDTARSLQDLAQSIAWRASEAVGAIRSDPLSVAAVDAALGKALDVRLEELRAAGTIRSGPETIVDRTGKTADVAVLHLGAFAAYAGGDNGETSGLLRMQPEGPPLVVGPRLDAEQRAMLSAAAAGRGSALPLDITGALRDRMPGGEAGTRAWSQKGGLFIYPILLVAFLGIVLVVERLLYLLATQRPVRLVDEMVALVQRGQFEPARDRARAVRGPTGRVITAAIEAHGRMETDREAAMESALLVEAPKMERSLALLSALASVAPLLGLLGTVSGMIMTFDTIAVAGTGNPRLLSGGISEALITTQFGLMVGIPLLLVHAWLARWVERREAILECDAMQVFGLHERRELDA